MPAKNKEQIYDETIAPMIHTIVGVCIGSGIAMIASFSIPTEKSNDLVAITNIPDETGSFPERHAAAQRELLKDKTMA